MKTRAKILILLAIAVAVAAAIALKQNKTPAAGNSPAQATVAPKLPRLVDLGAGKCVPCKMMKPILDELKRARILWHLIKYKEPYDPAVWAKAEEKLKQKKIKRLQQNAAALGFKLLTAS